MSSDTKELLRQNVKAVSDLIRNEKPDREKKEDVGATSEDAER